MRALRPTASRDAGGNADEHGEGMTAHVSTLDAAGSIEAMRIGQALLLTAFGAILADAVTFSVPGIDRNALGAVLFFVGLLWLAVEVALVLVPGHRRRPRRPAPTRVRRPPPPPYDPVLPPRGSPPPVDPEAPTSDASG